MVNHQPEDWVKTREVAEMWGVCEQTVRNHAKEHPEVLKPVRLGGGFKFKFKNIQLFEEQKRVFVGEEEEGDSE